MRVLVTLAKRPEPGAVKTRMCPPLSPEDAAALYAAMLADVLHTTARAARRGGAVCWLAVHPGHAAPELAAAAPGGTAVLAQRGGDLAARMADLVRVAAAAGATRILLRGSDNPTLPADVLLAGLAALDEADLAVGPDRDGGYGWIALRRPVPGLFAHPMSTRSVLDDTLENAAGAGLRVWCGAAHFDLDTAADLAALASARRDGAECPRTLACLDERDLWRHVPTD